MARSWSSLPWKRSGADEFKSLQIVLQNFRITSLFVMETDIRDDLETKIIGSIFLKVKVCMSLLVVLCQFENLPPSKQCIMATLMKM